LVRGRSRELPIDRRLNEASAEVKISRGVGQEANFPGSRVTPFGFQGSYADSTGLIYLIKRYYDPTTDQFLSIDPDVAATDQPYVFTNDNLLNAADPLGDIPVQSQDVGTETNRQLAKAVATILWSQRNQLVDLNNRNNVWDNVAGGVGIVFTGVGVGLTITVLIPGAPEEALGAVATSIAVSSVGFVADTYGCAVRGNKLACVGATFAAASLLSNGLATPAGAAWGALKGFSGSVGFTGLIVDTFNFFRKLF
jgi:RHS repeat-associated protein